MENKNFGLKVNRHKHIMIGLIFASLTAVISAIYLYWPVTDGIHSYNSKRDRQAILNVFEQDWYWLVAGDRNSFSPEYMLDAKSPNKYNLEVQGKEQVKVLLANGKTVGFVSYYKKKAYLGQIHILHVLPEYRGHGYAQKLMRAAINELFSDPAISFIKLVTRTDNAAAIKLYNRLGFIEEMRDETLVDFILKPENYIK